MSLVLASPCSVRCVYSIGKRPQMDILPYITGPVKVYLGDDIRLSGYLTIARSHVFGEPEFRVRE